jgi:hypothetical protein
MTHVSHLISKSDGNSANGLVCSDNPIVGPAANQH